MARRIVYGVGGVVAIVASLWLLNLAAPAFVLRTLVSLKTHFTHVDPNREVVWPRGAAPATLAGGRRPPNIIVILADDLGFNDLTFSGGGVANGAVPTPNIDSIARGGVTLANGYAGNATCAPSRAAIMTGRYATRFGFEFTPVPLALNKVLSRESYGGLDPIYHADREADLPDVGKMGLPADEITIAELLRSNGYRTLMLGKWHLGERPEMAPAMRGFDDALAFLPGGALYMPEDDDHVVNAHIPTDPADQFLWNALTYSVSFNSSPLFAPKGYLTDYLADEAVRAIDANRGRPFFLYLAFNAPHTPLQALKSDYDALSGIEDHRLRVYAAMVRALDRGVGRVMDALKERGLDDNTLVIFTSDNGGAGWAGLPDINKPYRGWKATFFEGGIHVPFFMKWPGVLPAGSAYESPVAHVDIFATSAAVAGASLPPGRILDGVDLMPFLTQAAPAPSGRALFWRSGGYRSLVAGDWKLQTSDVPERIWLFNLAKDPTERLDLSKQEPGKLRELTAMMDEIDASQANPLWPSILEVPTAIDHPAGIPIGESDDFIYWSN
jgi:arylsulfatase A-like enzyme